MKILPIKQFYSVLSCSSQPLFSFRQLQNDEFQRTNATKVRLTNKKSDDNVIVERYKTEKGKVYDIVCEKEQHPEDYEKMPVFDIGLDFQFYAEFLREMQWNNGEINPPRSWFEYNHKQNPEKYPTQEVYLDLLKKEMLALVNKQHKILAKSEPLKYPHTFYRGVNLNENTAVGFEEDFAKYMNSSKVGDVIVPDYSISYAAKDVRLALDYNDKNILVIRTKPNARIFAGHYKNNREVIFPPMSKFKVLSKRKVDGLNVIELEYLCNKT